jgi:hypothetical protein
MKCLNDICRPKDAALPSKSCGVRTRDETYLEHHGRVCDVDDEYAESGYRVFSHAYNGAHVEARTPRVNTAASADPHSAGIVGAAAASSGGASCELDDAGDDGERQRHSTGRAHSLDPRFVPGVEVVDLVLERTRVSGKVRTTSCSPSQAGTFPSPSSSLRTMNAFDTIEASVDDVVDEWRASTGIDDEEKSSSAHAEAFKRGLVGIVRAFFACKQDGRAADRDDKVEALGDALQVVASVRASLEALLLLREGRAQLVLEALQLVRPSFSSIRAMLNKTFTSFSIKSHLHIASASPPTMSCSNSLIAASALLAPSSLRASLLQKGSPSAVDLQTCILVCMRASPWRSRSYARSAATSARIK